MSKEIKTLINNMNIAKHSEKDLSNEIKKLRKKAHLIRAGRTLCRAENAYKKQPRYTAVENPEPWQVCRNCLGLDGRSENSPQAADRVEQYAEPRLSVLMGERVAEGLPGEVADNHASETTIFGAG